MIARPPYTGAGVLALADGRVFRGLAFGANKTVVAEVVFNTSMTGYQEILTDPSYVGQMVCLTASEIGNVGMNPWDAESYGHGAEGLLVRALSVVVSNWRSEESLPAWLVRRGVPALGEFDTRALTRHLRKKGAVMAALSTEHTDADQLVDMARQAPAMEGRGLGHEVSTTTPYTWDEPSLRIASQPDAVPGADLHVVAYDFGIKHNILRCMRDEGIKTTVVPSTASADEVIALEPDGIFLSNGPGDPAALPDAVERIRDLLEARGDRPMFGICLGHQLLCLALGGTTYKLKFGHHGGNHPVRDESGGRVEITAQNHGFAANLASLGAGARLTHTNLFDQTVAGLELIGRHLRGVQYHPEASPGPHDARHFFRRFAEEMRERRARAGG